MGTHAGSTSHWLWQDEVDRQLLYGDTHCMRHVEVGGHWLYEDT